MPSQPADRLLQYLAFRGIRPREFELRCGMSNGYLKKQVKGKGTIGSEKLKNIREQYPDLDMDWVLWGTGEMFLPSKDQGFREEEGIYLTAKDEIIEQLRRQIALLESAIADKNKIIGLLESAVSRR